MYIIHETIAGDDPRFDSRAEVIGHYWHFTIRKILDASVYTGWIPHEVIDENVAKSHKLTGSYKGEISLPSKATNYEEFRQASGENVGTSRKFIYKLTSTDINNVVKLMQASMRIFAKNHIEDKSVVSKLIDLVNSAKTIEQCEQLLHDYFNVDSALTHGTPRDPKFKIEWIWKKI